MSIDRIGKGPGAPPPPQGPTSTTNERGGTFQVDATRPATAVTPGAGASGAGASGAAGGARAVAGPSPAEQVRRGEMSVDQYLDLRVQEATRHLDGKLSAGDLTRVQQTLRTQLAQDPFLRDLVTSATGQVPPSDDA